MAAPQTKKKVIVLGAGVVGLTTALKLQQTGKYRVTIISEVLPNDPKSIRYTSSWAGAHHVYNRDDGTGQHACEEETFKVMWDMSAPGSDSEGCFLRIPQTDYFFHERVQPDPLDKMPNSRYLKPEELISGAKSGWAFTTITIDVPVYLNYLLTKFLDLGGHVLRGSIIHIHQILEGGTSLFSGGSDLEPKPEAVVVCFGLGARFLGGLEDKNVYPVRGQTVLIRAPWIKFGRTETSLAEGRVTYVIPRRSGDVIVGGTRLVDDWYPLPRPETTEDILSRGLVLCPELAPSEARVTTGPPTVDDISPIVIEEGCGLRPARKGGVRIELEWVEGDKIKRDGRVAVVYNYGHDGFGYLSSWGYATKVLKLLDEALGVES